MHRWFGKSVAASIVAAALVFSGTEAAQASVLQAPETVGSDVPPTEAVSGLPYSLHLHHLHTGETLNITYRIGDVYLPQALARLNYFLRDHRTMDVTEYDPREFDLLHSVMAKLGRPSGLIDIVCGYRTPDSNQYLRTRAAVTGVAEHSQHMEGHAIDIKVPGVRTATLRDAALSMQGGGVGYYPSSQFVHVDVGPVREWQFGRTGRRSVRAVGTHGVKHHGHRHRA